jgi:hypothetical protein
MFRCLIKKFEMGKACRSNGGGGKNAYRILIGKCGDLLLRDAQQICALGRLLEVKVQRKPVRGAEFLISWIRGIEH